MLKSILNFFGSFKPSAPVEQPVATLPVIPPVVLPDPIPEPVPVVEVKDIIEPKPDIKKPAAIKATKKPTTKTVAATKTKQVPQPTGRKKK